MKVIIHRFLSQSHIEHGCAYISHKVVFCGLGLVRHKCQLGDELLLRLPEQPRRHREPWHRAGLGFKMRWLFQFC